MHASPVNANSNLRATEPGRRVCSQNNARQFKVWVFMMYFQMDLISAAIPAYPAIATMAASPKSVRHTNILRRSEEHTSELQSLMRISYAVFCLKKNTTTKLTQ